jgi:hypothetical protein
VFILCSQKGVYALILKCVWACVHACVCVRACVHVCVCVCLMCASLLGIFAYIYMLTSSTPAQPQPQTASLPPITAGPGVEIGMHGYMYVYIHTSLPLYIHTYIHTYIYIYIRPVVVKGAIGTPSWNTGVAQGQPPTLQRVIRQKHPPRR